MSQWVEVVFGVRGQVVELDHGWRLFGALAARVEGIHGSRPGSHQIQPSPILDGRPLGGRWLDLGGGDASLRIRCNASRVAEVVEGLSEESLDVGGQVVHLTAPLVRAIHPYPALVCRLVVFSSCKGAPVHGGPGFVGELRRQLAEERGVEGARVTLGRRRAVRVRRSRLVGYGVKVEGLDARGSRILQVAGLGGRRHQGCGFFVEERT